MNYLSRYEITCPDCGARFVPHKFEGLNFRCPCCGLLLERDNGNLPYVLALASAILAGAVAFRWGLRGLLLVATVICGSFLGLAIFASVLFYIRPPTKVRAKPKFGDTELRLK